MSEPSQSTANKLLRVLRGEPLKFTCRVHLPGGEIVEFQSNHLPVVVWHNEARALWLQVKSGDEYQDNNPVMQWREGAVLTCEQNPGWKEGGK